MKYQQLENLECGWKWDYLIKKARAGEVITRYIEKSAEENAVSLLLKIENQPDEILRWISLHIAPQVDHRMKQSIRARRKRHFNAEHQHTRKKSIDLNFSVWQRLSNLAVKRNATLSETIIQLIEDAEHKDKYESQMNFLKQDLQAILGSSSSKK